jgi:acetyl esterase/lipase
VFALIRKAFRLKVPFAMHLRLWRWMSSTAAREYPWAFGALGVLAIALLVLLGALESAFGVIVIVLVALGVLVEANFARQSLGAAEATREALAEIDLDPSDGARFPLSNVLFPPLMLLPKGVRHRRGVEYARRGRRALRLDVYEPAEPRGEHEPLRPAIVQVHGGGWVVGSRVEQGIPLLNHLAGQGWVGFNIDYRLSPRATFPDQVVDVKQAIAWVREHAAEYGADPDFICITGGSAGGHLCALAALTASDPSLQPGFEGADTSVAAAVPFYGVYDLTNAEGEYYPELRFVLERYVFKAKLDHSPERFRLASPTYRVHRHAPPFLVVHGDHDTIVPVGDARRFVATLRAASDSPVLYAELAGAEHAFDFGPTVRTARVVEAIERFLDAVHDRNPAVARLEAIG